MITVSPPDVSWLSWLCPGTAGTPFRRRQGLCRLFLEGVLSVLAVSVSIAYTCARTRAHTPVRSSSNSQDSQDTPRKTPATAAEKAKKVSWLCRDAARTPGTPGLRNGVKYA